MKDRLIFKVIKITKDLMNITSASYRFKKYSKMGELEIKNWMKKNQFGMG